MVISGCKVSRDGFEVLLQRSHGHTKPSCGEIFCGILKISL